MKKEEFFKNLKEKLSILEESEIKDIIEEYRGYIDEKIKNGATEEEAIEDFGDIDELAKELLKAYKINVDNQKENKNWFSEAAEKINQWMDGVVKFFSEKDFHEILRILIEVFVILLGIGLLKLPFHFLEQMGTHSFAIFQNNFGDYLSYLWRFIIEVAYIIFAVVLFIKIFERRYLNEEKEKEIVTLKKEPKQNSVKTKTNEVKKEKIGKEKRYGFFDFLADACIWFLKFIGFWILLGIAFYILGLGCGVGVCIYLMVRGVSYYGIYISILILLVLGVLAFILLFNWILGRKNNGKALLIAFLTSFVLLGISFSYASIEVASTEYIIGSKENTEIKTIEEFIDYQKDLTLFGNFTYEEDDTLENQIKITYAFNSIYQIESDMEYLDNNRLFLDWTYQEGIWNGKILEDIIDDLKEHQIHNYFLTPTITVTTSSKNIKQLKENKSHWNENRYSNNQEQFCKRQLEQNGVAGLSSYCKNLLNLEEEETI